MEASTKLHAHPVASNANAKDPIHMAVGGPGVLKSWTVRLDKRYPTLSNTNLMEARIREPR